MLNADYRYLPIQRIPARTTLLAACVYYQVRVKILTYHFLCLQTAKIVCGSRRSCKSTTSSTMYARKKIFLNQPTLLESFYQDLRYVPHLACLCAHLIR